jgi:hypothetical protein
MIGIGGNEPHEVLWVEPDALFVHDAPGSDQGTAGMSQLTERASSANLDTMYCGI